MGRKVLLLALLISTLTFSSAPQSDREAQEEARRALTQLEKDYVLLKKGQFEFEEMFSFTYYSANQIYLESFAILDPVFLTLGKFGIERARRHIFVNTFSLRYGILDNLQLDISVPFVYRYDRLSRGASDPEETIERADLGDITVGLSLQPIRETHTRPALILNFGYKSKTGVSPYEIDPKKEVPSGTGYQSLRFGVSTVKSVDPVVVFGSLSYTHNLHEGVNQTVTGDTGSTTIERVYPGGSFALGVGFAYALAYNFSLNVQFINNYIMHTFIKTKGAPKTRVPNSSFNTAMLKLGTGWAVSRSVPLNFSLYLGLTQDSPDYTVEIRIPVKF